MEEMSRAPWSFAGEKKAPPPAIALKVESYMALLDNTLRPTGSQPESVEAGRRANENMLQQ
eukprot:5505795-Prymnesium_polylepis.1